MKTFRDLKIWEKAHSLILDIYKASKDFPKEELYGLTSQIRRSTVSIAANIVEGFKRKQNKEFLRFLNIADASLEETKYFLILLNDLNYLPNEKYDCLMNKCTELGAMMNAFQRSIIGNCKEGEK